MSDLLRGQTLSQSREVSGEGVEQEGLELGQCDIGLIALLDAPEEPVEVIVQSGHGLVEGRLAAGFDLSGEVVDTGCV